MSTIKKTVKDLKWNIEHLEKFLNTYKSHLTEGDKMFFDKELKAVNTHITEVKLSIAYQGNVRKNKVVSKQRPIGTQQVHNNIF